MSAIRTVHLVLAAAVIAAPLPLVADQQRERASGHREESTAKIDLNSASEKTLAGVPGIGPELARAIVAARPFRTIDDLSRLEGISAERFEHIRLKATVVPPAESVRETLTGKASDAQPGTRPVREAIAGKASEESSAPTGRASRPLDLNTAPQHELANVPTIGPELARAIVAARPFQSVDELTRLPGVNAERLEQIRAQVVVSAPRPAARDAKSSR